MLPFFTTPSTPCHAEAVLWPKHPYAVSMHDISKLFRWSFRNVACEQGPANALHSCQPIENPPWQIQRPTLYRHFGDSSAKVRPQNDRGRRCCQSDDSYDPNIYFLQFLKHA